MGGDKGDGGNGIVASCTLQVVPAVGPAIMTVLDDVVEFFGRGIETEVVPAVVGGEEVVGEGVKG